jgi:hypothetical protein
MTVIEIKPHRWGWKVFEAPGVEPVFPEKRQAISYAEGHASFSLRRDSRSRFEQQCRARYSGRRHESKAVTPGPASGWLQRLDDM